MVCSGTIFNYVTMADSGVINSGHEPNFGSKTEGKGAGSRSAWWFDLLWRIVCGIVCSPTSKYFHQLPLPKALYNHVGGGSLLNTNQQIQIKLRWALFVTYTIIQSIMGSEMCSLHLTHPSAHTWSSGQPTVRRLGSSRGLMDRALWLETRGNPRLWVRIPALAGSVHDWGETLEQGTEPPGAAMSAAHCSTWMG